MATSSSSNRTPTALLKALVIAEGRDVRVVLVLGVAFALLSLAVPIGAQTVVGLISFGTVSQPLLLLLFLILLGLLLGAALRAVQTWLMERVERRFLVRIAHQVAQRASQIQDPRSVHRFFEVLTIQKTASMLLLDGSMLALQALLGMLLLAFYHPFLLAFDVLLCLGLWFIFRVLGSGGIGRAAYSCAKKHQVIDAIDSAVAGKLPPEEAGRVTEEALGAYLASRESYFQVLLRQIVGSLGLQAVANILLLALGGVLVIRNQLTLGQLVAAEIVVNGVLSSLAKFQKHLDGFYDLAAGVGKVDDLLGGVADWKCLKERRGSFRSIIQTRSLPGHYRLEKRIIVGMFLAPLLLAFLPWQQTASGYGRVIAFSPQDRPQEIHAPVEGRVSEWRVSEGSTVKAGDVLVELSDNDPELIERLEIERKAIRRRVQASVQALETSKFNLDRQKELFEKGLSSKRQYEQARLEFARFQADESSAAAELARIDVRLSRQLSQTVRAPMDGTVLRILAPSAGQMLKQGAPLVLMIPEAQARAAELWVDGNDLPLLSVGKEVRLQFEGWPALQFSGWPSVAVGTFGGKIQLIDAADNGKGQFRILVMPEKSEPWPEPKYLRQGVRVHAFILLGQVTLGYELWRRFNGFPVSVSVEQMQGMGAASESSAAGGAKDSSGEKASK